MSHVSRITVQHSAFNGHMPNERSPRTDCVAKAKHIFPLLHDTFKLIDISANKNIARRVVNVLVAQGLVKERNIQVIDGRVILKFDKVKHDPGIYKPA